MKGSEWHILIGDNNIEIVSEEPIDGLEATTRAIEKLHNDKKDYRIAAFTLAECKDKGFWIKSDVALANAGRYAQCRKLQELIAEHKKNAKKKV